MVTDSNQLLLLNTDVLAVAAGYTRHRFLRAVGLSSSDYDRRISHGGQFSNYQVNCIEQFVYCKDDPWLTGVFEDAKLYLLPRSRICTYGTEHLPDSSPRTILQANLRAFRYFFNIPISIFTKETGCSISTINAIETGRIKVADKTYEKVYKYLLKLDKSFGLDRREERLIFKRGHQYPITTKIPSRMRC